MSPSIDPFDPEHIRPEPLTFWPRVALVAALICSGLLAWWCVGVAVVDGVQFIRWLS